MSILNLDGEVVEDTVSEDLVVRAEQEIIHKVDLTIQKLNALAEDYKDFGELHEAITDVLAFCEKEFESLKEIVTKGFLRIELASIPIEEDHQELRETLLKEMMYFIEENSKNKEQ